MPGRELNASACEALVEAVVWDDPRAITILTVIAFIDLMVIVGNCLVIAAVYISSKLRSVTNLFIVSLAVADLMVGLAVLPFSATWEVFKVVTYNINFFFFKKKVVTLLLLYFFRPRGPEARAEKFKQRKGKS